MASVNVLAIFVNIISLPIIIRAIGLEEYGKYIFLFIQCQLLALMVEYSFNIFAIKEAEGCDKKASQLLSRIIILRLIIYFLVGTVIFYILSVYYDVQVEVLLILLLSVLPNCFLFTWYFQFNERMTYVAISNLAGRVLYLAILLLPISKGSIYFAFAYCISNFTIAILNLYFLIIKQDKHLQWCLDKYSFDLARRGFPYFIYKLATGLAPTINSNIALLYGGGNLVAKLDIFSKLASAVTMIFSAVVQVVYPKLVISSQSEIVVIVRNYLLYASGVCLVLILLILAVENNIDFITSFIIGEQVRNIDTVLLLSIVFVFTCTLNSIYSRVFIVKNNVRLVNNLTYVQLASLLIFSPVLVSTFQDIGLFIGAIISQALMLSVLVFRFYR